MLPILSFDSPGRMRSKQDSSASANTPIRSEPVAEALRQIGERQYDSLLPLLACRLEQPTLSRTNMPSAHSSIISLSA